MSNNEQPAEKQQQQPTAEKQQVEQPSESKVPTPAEGNDLGDALGLGEGTVVAGHTIESMNMEQIAEVTGHFTKMQGSTDLIIDFIMDKGTDVADDDSAALELGKTIIDLLGREGKVLFDLVAAGTGIAREDVGKMKPDVFVPVVIAFVRVNLDFFVQKLMPTVNLAMEGINTSLAGMTQSNT